MTLEKTDSTNIWPYVGIYILTTIVLWLIWLAFVSVVPAAEKSGGTAIGVATIFGSTLVSYSMFIKRNGRLLDRGEYWKIVIFTTAATLLFSIVSLLFSIAAGLTPGNLNSIPAGVWIMMLVMGALFGFCLNAAGFSNRFGRTLLKANRKRQTQLDTEPFR